jgi:hypothetical protein
MSSEEEFDQEESSFEEGGGSDDGGSEQSGSDDGSDEEEEKEEVADEGGDEEEDDDDGDDDGSDDGDGEEDGTGGEEADFRSDDDEDEAAKSPGTQLVEVTPGGTVQEAATPDAAGGSQPRPQQRPRAGISKPLAGAIFDVSLVAGLARICVPRAVDHKPFPASLQPPTISPPPSPSSYPSRA